MHVLNAWGFKYTTGFPWVKIKDISKDLWGQHYPVERTDNPSVVGYYEYKRREELPGIESV